MSRKASNRKHHRKGAERRGQEEGTGSEAAPTQVIIVPKSAGRVFFEVIVLTSMSLVCVVMLVLYHMPEKQDAPPSAAAGATDATATEASPTAATREPENASAPPPLAAEDSPGQVGEPELASADPAQVTQDDPPEPEPNAPRERASKAPSEAEIAAQLDALYPMPSPPPLMEIVDHWNKVPESAYPEAVTVSVPVGFKVLRDGSVIGKSKIPAGSQVVPRELENGILTISASQEGSSTATVPVDQTDFKQRVRERYERFSKERTERVVAQRGAERKRLLKVYAHEKALSSYNLGDDPRFEALKASLRSGEAGFFELEAASQWRWADKETVEGVDYETAYVMMVSESAFGVSERELKALIHEGKVASWIDVASGEKL